MCRGSSQQARTSPGVLFLAGSLLIWGTVIWPKEAVAAEERRLADYLWAGIKAQREQLKAGVVQITWITTTKEKLDAERSKKTTVELSFDRGRAKRLYRIAEGQEKQRIWMNTQDAWYGWRPGSGAVLEIMPPTYLRGRHEFTPDISIVGIGPPAAVQMGRTFEQLEEALWQRLEFHDARREAEGLYSISWLRHENGADLLQTILVNESKAFTTEQYTLRVHKEGVNATKSKPVVVLTASWEARGGTWIPVHAEGDEMGSRHTEFKLDWRSVNQPLAPDVFDVEKLGIPKGTLIVDSRLDKRQPIIVGKVGEPDYQPPFLQPRK